MDSISTNRLGRRWLNVHHRYPHDGITEVAVDIFFEETSLSFERDMTMTEGGET